MNLFSAFSRLVALPHSVFALPFAIASFVLAFDAGPTANEGRSPLVLLAFVVVAVVAARTAAMAFNRLLDADLDGQNPRTAGREIPQGAVSRKQAGLLVVFTSAIFFAASAALGFHCFILSPIVLFVLLFYSYTKRFTPYAHFVLGVSLALAPGGAWWVLRPRVEATPLALMGAVLLWVAGFDLLYSCQDIAFDREHGVFSLPARLGIDATLFTAKVAHIVSVALFFLAGWCADLPGTYFLGMLGLGSFLLGQHVLISPIDLRRINQAFFTMNGAVSLLYLCLIALSVHR
ncbi:MAG: UbiA-like polyprenyltransferase [Bdellovibrionota bacterium]